MLDDVTLDRIASGIARGEYSLLLGAGASIGARGGNKNLLPSGPQLRDHLIRDFSIPTGGEDVILSRAYAAARRQEPDRLKSYILEWFTGCSPTWQHSLTQMQWHRIWTLNIDDVVENAYEAKSIKIDHFDWTSRHRDRSYSTNQIVHLHGYAGDLAGGNTNLDHLVFSVNDYAATLVDGRTWHAVFIDEFAELPFIILGASLVEEFDLQQALQQGTMANQLRGLPSVIVLKSVTELQRDELTALGLLVVEADAEDFIAEMCSRVQAQTMKLASEFGGDFSPEVSRFLQQFIDLRAFQPRHNLQRHDFYSGYEPQWSNIANEDDAAMEITEALFSSLSKADEASETSQSIHVLTGSSGTGKSTGLLRIARNFVGKDRLPFLFRADEDLDVDATTHWLERYPNTVLFVDNCADFAQSLQELATQCASRNLKLLAVGAERTVRRRILRDRISGSFLHIGPEYEYRLLSESDVASLISKLESRRRLGRITRRSKQERHDYFWRLASRRLFDGMANLEGGEGFRNRIRTGFLLIQDKHLKDIYSAASIAYQLGYPLPIGIASKAGSIPVRRLRTLLEDTDIMVVTQQGVRPPHRITASIVVDSVLSQDEKYDAMHRLMFALSPHVDINAIRNLTRHHRLLRQLLDEEAVMRLVGRRKGRDLYDAVQKLFDWNGRYWDQRALFESRLGNNAQARSYAERSIQVQAHPFAFNTLGTILGRIAFQSGDVEKLRECVKNLESSRDRLTRDTSEHPYITFFSTMNKFGQEWGLESIPVSLRNSWTEWFNQSQRELLFSHPEGQTQLRDFQNQWLRLAVTSSGN